MTDNALIDFFGKPISVYSRTMAIADGILIDVTKRAREAGFMIPVAITDTAWRKCVEWTKEDTSKQHKILKGDYGMCFICCALL